MIAGHIAKDIHIKISDTNRLPNEFKKLFKISTPMSMIGDVLDKQWSFEHVLEVLKDNTIEPISYSYGGRGSNVAYGAALLGADIELIGFVGEDFDKEYPGFFNGAYSVHLKNAGVNVNELVIGSDELRRVDEEGHKHGVLVVKAKETSSIYCIKDSYGIDFYIIDDVKGAHVYGANGPIAKQLINRCDGVFVTSGEPLFNQRLIDYACQRGKEVFFDIAAYETTAEYLRYVIPRCNTVLGNTYEIELVKTAFNAADTRELFRASPNLSTIIVEDKIACVIKIHQKERRRPLKIGPVAVEERVSSVGCCDGIAAGYLALYSQGHDIITAAKAGLLQCANIWQVEGVQEGMLNRQRLFHKLRETCIPLEEIEP